LGETSLPGRQNADTRIIQGDLHGQRLCRHSQRAATYLAAKKKAERAAKSAQSALDCLPVTGAASFLHPSALP